MGIHLGLEPPSAAVTGLALRHAILPKQYQRGYESQALWESYGTPKYLYTDAGSDFTSAHIDQVASRLGIVLCLRRRPAEGGIVERPFGTLNREFFSTLPGYTTAIAKPHLASINAEACLTLEQLEGLLVSNPKAQSLLLQATRGYIGVLNQILCEAAIRALQRGQPRIELPLLRQVVKECSLAIK